MAKKKEKSDKKTVEKSVLITDKDSGKKEKKKAEKKATSKKGTLLRPKGSSLSPETAINNEAQQIHPDEISLRAYFIGQNRLNMGLAGDPITDWITAETELTEEVKNKRRR